MTPRKDVEALAKSLSKITRLHDAGCGDVYPIDIPECTRAATMLRALLAERDNAYRRGQEDMREAAATVKPQMHASANMRATLNLVLKGIRSEIRALPIKDGTEGPKVGT